MSSFGWPLGTNMSGGVHHSSRRHSSRLAARRARAGPCSAFPRTDEPASRRSGSAAQHGRIQQGLQSWGGSSAATCGLIMVGPAGIVMACAGGLESCRVGPDVGIVAGGSSCRGGGASLPSAATLFFRQLGCRSGRRRLCLQPSASRRATSLALPSSNTVWRANGCSFSRRLLPA